MKTYLKMGLDDQVLINGQWGFFDFWGEDMISIVDREDRRYNFKYKDIKSGIRLPTFLVGNMTEVTFRIDDDGMHECTEEEFKANFHRKENPPLYDCIVEDGKGYFVLNTDKNLANT